MDLPWHCHLLSKIVPGRLSPASRPAGEACTMNVVQSEIPDANTPGLEAMLLTLHGKQGI